MADMWDLDRAASKWWREQLLRAWEKQFQSLGGRVSPTIRRRVDEDHRAEYPECWVGLTVGVDEPWTEAELRAVGR